MDIWNDAAAGREWAAPSQRLGARFCEVRVFFLSLPVFGMLKVLRVGVLLVLFTS
jgi:hypothetical protein